ncbi:hypothetical protein Q1695_001947 [Nippostrongylus brasiliensis]|nr:hypothetical protein Q1695_001947 [Nippostrongylus brasiliensis]
MRCVSALPFAVLLLFSVTLAADSEVEPTFAETGGDQQTGDSTPIESQIVVFNGTSANDALDFMGADGQRIRAKRYYGCG